jgi:hypothetical protein
MNCAILRRFLPRQIGDISLKFLLYRLEFRKLGDAQHHFALQLDQAVELLFLHNDFGEYVLNVIASVELAEPV